MFPGYVSDRVIEFANYDSQITFMHLQDNRLRKIWITNAKDLNVGCILCFLMIKPSNGHVTKN